MAHVLKRKLTTQQKRSLALISDKLADNDDLDVDTEGIDIMIEEGSSVNFTIETTLEGNITWEIIEFTRGDMVEEYQAQAIPVSLNHHEGYIVAKESSGTPTGGWDEFDSTVLAAADGNAEDMRFSLAEVDRSAGAIFTMGLLLGVLVYFHHVHSLSCRYLILRQPRST